MAKGVPLRIVADKGRPTREGCGADGLLASNSVASRPRVPESLRGARIGYTEASVAEYVLEGFLEKGGLKRDDFEFIYVQTQNAGPALASGAIDFRLISEPAISNVVRRRQGKLWLKLADMQPEVQWACVVFGKSLLDDRETGLRFLRAYLRGVRRYNEGKTPSNVASVVRHTGLSADDVRASCWTQIRNDGQIDLPALMSFQRWGHRRGYLDQVLDPSKFYDPWFLERQTNRSAAP
jgi:NitT/TauT family transport system substrate-binding protein